MDPAGLYHSPRLAEAYARSRPPVHARIVEAVVARFHELGIERARAALDLGCGSGLSTAALEPLAARSFGLDPSIAMLRHAGGLAPRAAFAAGRSEELPFRDAAFDLVAAAGSLNYTDLARVLPDVARVLAPRGVFLVYDFSSGRRLAGDLRLDRWFASFERRYPYPPGYEMDVKSLDYAAAGLRMASFDEFQVAVPMTGAAYLAYAMSETNVELAIAAGEPEQAIEAWCAGAIREIFAAGPREVLFEAYAACVRPSLPSAA